MLEEVGRKLEVKNTGVCTWCRGISLLSVQVLLLVHYKLQVQY